MELGAFGIWWSGWQDDDGCVEAAAEMEELGYGAIWMSGGFVPGMPKRVGALLEATSKLTVATGITNIWLNGASDLAGEVMALEERYGGRFLLGLGVSHAPVVEAYGDPYVRPLAKMRAYLDELDADGRVAPGRRVLAALGPNMLRLAADRSLGAHPYFTTVEHTAYARGLLGSGPILTPEVAVVLDDDPASARSSARQYMSVYLTLPNYVNNLKSFGFTDEDVAEGGSDRIVDAVVPWGRPEAVAARLIEHRDAGADHVCVQVVASGAFPRDSYRELASALGL